MGWDIFICHASEDKEDFVRPLAEALRESPLKVWYDEFSLTLGDSLRRSIDRGLKESRFGVFVLSPSFFEKQWPQLELDGLAQREIGGEKAILPIWHNVNRENVMRYSPILADRVAIETNRGLDIIIKEVLRAIQSVGLGTQPMVSCNHRVHANFQGQLSIRMGNIVEISRWFGPEGPGGEWPT